MGYLPYQLVNAGFLPSPPPLICPFCVAEGNKKLLIPRFAVPVHEPASPSLVEPWFTFRATNFAGLFGTRIGMIEPFLAWLPEPFFAAQKEFNFRKSQGKKKCTWNYNLRPKLGGSRWIKVIHPRKWNLNMMVFNGNLLFQGFIFRFHVSFTGCKHLKDDK